MINYLLISLAMLSTLAHASKLDSYHIDAREIIYLNEVSLNKTINGANKIKALGNHNNRRIYYKNINKSQKVKEVYAEIDKLTNDLFPFAVIVDGRIYNKDDDHCTKIADVYRGVEIVDSCILHDFCYYQIADYEKFNYGFKKSFNYCHDQFLVDLRKQKKTQMPKKKVRNFGLALYLGVKYIPYSYSNYRLNQDKNAHLIKLILTKSKNDQYFKDLIADTKILDLTKMGKEYTQYCRAFKKAEKFPKHIDHPRDNLSSKHEYACAK